jgi:hypothetical protein
MNARAVVGLTLLALLSGCGSREEAAPPRNDWFIRSHVAFVDADGKTPRPAPKEALRLWMPYVVGDIYGDPNEGATSEVPLNPDLSFTLDLNAGHAGLEKALIPTKFSQKWMQIEPQETRVARLSPFVLPVDGIVPVGTSEWLDADTGHRLMLVYFDRPARIRGEIVYEGRNLRFDIETKESGYVWIRQPEGSGEFTMAPWPGRVILALMP